ncbi:hypothetical protein LTS06_012683, partial [Exophiala xenobiotica]
DDGSHSVACERCSVWQHSKCLGISKSAAEKEDFHFICRDCKRKEEDAKKPKISLKFRVGTSSSPAPPSPVLPIEQPPQKSTTISVEVPGQNVARPPTQGSMMNGYAAQGSSPPTQPTAIHKQVVALLLSLALLVNSIDHPQQGVINNQFLSNTLHNANLHKTVSIQPTTTAFLINTRTILMVKDH